MLAVNSTSVPAQIALPGYSFETGEKGPGLNVLMGDIDPDNAADYQSNAKQFFDQYLGQTIPCVPPLPHRSLTQSGGATAQACM